MAATVGSAVGLGNVWRFPAEVQANGGAAFLLIYILCVLLLGIPVMLSEFTIGRTGRTDAVGAFTKLSPGKPWWLIGLLGVIASFIILSFYMVVSGWTLEYMFYSLTGDLYRPESGASAVDFGTKMDEYICSDFRPIIFTGVMIVLNAYVLVRGVTKGIEKISNLLMPVLFLLLLIFCFVSVSMPGAREGLDYFFYPDFSKINIAVIINALGQAFFSLSLGIGILITYASYFPKDTRLVKTSITVASLDLLVAVLMGIIIFPVITTFGINDSSAMRDGTLVFATLPEIFSYMEGTRLWSTLFFLSITVAALTSTISMGQVSIAFLQDRFNMTRRKAVSIVFAMLIPVSVVCSLSMGSWDKYTILGFNIFNFFDYVATNYMLPLGSLSLVVYVGWVLPKSTFRQQLTNDGTLKSCCVNLIYGCIKYLAPLLIAVIMISNLI